MVQPDLADKHDLIAVAAKDRKSTRLNSSHVESSYAVCCLKKKKCPFSGFFSCSEDSIRAGGCRRARHHRETRARGRGRAQQNVRNPGGGKTHRRGRAGRNRCSSAWQAWRVRGFRRSGQTRGSGFRCPGTCWRRAKIEKDGRGGASRRARL